MNHFKINLTHREIEILQLIAQEFSTREIAEKLFLSKSTVESHRRRMLMKMRVKNAAGLIRKGFELGVLTVDGDGV